MNITHHADPPMRHNALDKRAAIGDGSPPLSRRTRDVGARLRGRSTGVTVPERVRQVREHRVAVAATIEHLLEHIETLVARARALREALDRGQRDPQQRQSRDELRRELDDLGAELARLAPQVQQADALAGAATDVAKQTWTSLQETFRAMEYEMAQAEPVSELAQRQQLEEFVKFIGTMLQANVKPAKAHTGAGWHTPALSAMTATLQSRWSGFMAQVSLDGWVDVNQLIQWVMRQAYLDNTADMRYYAQRQKFFNELKKRLHDEATQARQLCQQPGTGATLAAPYMLLTFYDEPAADLAGNPILREPTQKLATTQTAILEEYIKDLERMLQAARDHAQAAHVDLQNMSKKQQQTLQTLSHLSKMLYDTSMAIIRKIGS